MKTTRLLLLLILIVLAILFFIWLIQLMFPRRLVLANVSTNSVSVRQPFSFSDSTHMAKSWVWLFGDGGKATTRTGTYIYKNPGKYLIKLIVDKDLTYTIPLTVVSQAAPDTEDEVISINGPLRGIQGEYLFFSSKGNDTHWRWNLGETPGVDSREATVVHKYNKPGKYTIHLMSKNSKYPAVFVVNILPAYKEVDSTDVGDLFDVTNGDIRSHLQQIAYGKDFNGNYYYLVNKYLCRDEHVPVSVDGKKMNDFFSYCMGLKLDKKAIIGSVTSEKKKLDSNTCVVRINVTQR